MRKLELTSRALAATTTAGIALLVLSLALVPAAHASTPIQAAGTWSATATSEAVVRTPDGNTVISLAFTETYTGTYSGTRVGTGTLMIHPDGTVNAQTTGTFSGSVAGIVGTILHDDECSGTLASFTCNTVDTDGTGGLAGVHGEGIVVGAATGAVTFAGTYSGQVHFAP